MARDRPSGNVTFLFSDIEGSTRLWDRQPDDMSQAVTRHDEIVRSVVDANRGYVFSTSGDGFAAAFQSAEDAFRAAVDIQGGLRAERGDWAAEIRVRIGLHTGQADERDGDYFGPTVNAAARVSASVRGDQVALSGEARRLVDVSTTDFGPHFLSGIGRPVDIHLATGDGLDGETPPRAMPRRRVLRDLVGRHEELAALAPALDEYRLVTLLGPGGVGKTSLALTAAYSLEDRFPGGVLVSELAGSSDDDDLEGLVARQLDVDSLDALRLRSSGTPTLVVLDNCESSLSQCRAIAQDLTSARSGITVLATSRTPLYAPAERLITIQPLSVSDRTDGEVLSPAASLYLARADEAGATWPHTEQNLDAVEQIASRLNGLPLAIELAAARARTLAPLDLLGLLDQQLDLLVRPGTARSRHHSLRDVIEASYEPLPPGAKRFLRTLAIFSAPFDLALAHTVAGGTATEMESLDLLDQLVDASLVAVREADEGQATYHLLDSIRAFGREKMLEEGELDDVGDRHADAMTAFAVETVMAALEAFSPEVLGRIRRRLAHLINALNWCLDHDDGPARSYQMFLLFYGPTGATAEVVELARRIRARWSEPAPLQAEAWAVMATSTFLHGEYEDGADLARAALEHPDATELAKMMGYRTLGYAAFVHSGGPAAAALLDQAVEIAEGFSPSFTRELKISRAAVIDDAAGSEEALSLLDAVREDASRSGDLIMVVWANVAAAYHHILLGRLPEAKRAADDALAVADESGLAWSVSTAHRYVAQILAIEDGWAVAAPHFRAALDSMLNVGDVDGVAMALRAAAGAAKHNGLDQLAKAIWETAPSRPGLPIPRSLFHDLQEELQAELGSTVRDSDSLVAEARRLLETGESAVATSAVEPTADASAPTDGTGPAVARSMIVSFGDYEFDAGLHELRRLGQRVPIEPQVFDVLALLIERRGALVSKNELLDEVWGDRFVSEAALSSRIASARKATGDTGRAQQVIRTVHGRGFTFVAEVDP